MLFDFVYTWRTLPPFSSRQGSVDLMFLREQLVYSVLYLDLTCYLPHLRSAPLIYDSLGKQSHSHSFAFYLAMSNLKL